MQGEQINTFTAVEEAGQVLSFPLARHACLVGAFTCLLAFSTFSSPPSIFSLPADQWPPQKILGDAHDQSSTSSTTDHSTTAIG